MVIENEFSHVVKMSDIGAGASKLSISADTEQRARLAARFDLAALDSLEADVALSRDAKGVLATGRFRAALTQYCVATREPVAARIDEPLNIRFVLEPVTSADAEIELEAGDCDTMFHDGQGVDIGEAVAQSLGLALDPYPRSPNADKHLRSVGVKNEEEAGPFGALGALKDKLAGK